MQIRFANSRPDGDYALVVAVAGKNRPALDAIGGERSAIDATLSRQRFEGESGSAAELFVPGDKGVRRVLVVGTGEGNSAADSAEKVGGTAVGRLPHPRLTGLGSGLFCGAAMLLLGFLDSALSGSLGLYSVLFLPVCVLTALWVREGDLLTAPVVVPNAFALGLLPAADHGGGLGGHLMGLVTALATEAGWLYGGTLIAGFVVLVRRVRLVARRAAIRGRAD